MLGRNRGAANNKEVNAGGDNGLGELGGALRREGAGNCHASCANLGDAVANQLWLDWLGINLLHASGGLLRRKLGDFVELLRWVFVASP